MKVKYKRRTRFTGVEVPLWVPQDQGPGTVSSLPSFRTFSLSEQLAVPCCIPALS